MRRLSFYTLVFALLGAAPWAQTLRAEKAFVVQARAGSTVALTLVLSNPAPQPLTLARGGSTAARRVVFRSHVRAGDTDKILSNGTLTIPPKSRVRLLPGATEVVMEDLTTDLIDGTEFPLLLQFSSGQSQVIRVRVTDR